jgi:hypothetical protein
MMKLLNTVVSVVGIIIVSVIVYAMVLMFYPYKTYELYTSPMEVLTPIVKAGEMLTIKVDGYRYADKPCTIGLQLINDSVILLPTFKSNMPAGAQDLEWKVRIPEYADAGHYRLVSTMIFKINALRTISVRNVSEDFDVIK